MSNVGKQVNIEKGATFNGKVSIGDYSGIGVDCEMNGCYNRKICQYGT